MARGAMLISVSLARDTSYTARPRIRGYCIASTHCAYQWRDGQAELTRVAGYILRWFTPPQTVTHPSNNRARRRVTSLIENSALHQVEPPPSFLVLSKKIVCNLTFKQKNVTGQVVDQVLNRKKVVDQVQRSWFFGQHCNEWQNESQLLWSKMVAPPPLKSVALFGQTP